MKCFQIALNIKRCALKREVGSNPLHFHCLCVFQLTREFFTKELKKHYLRNNDTDVFSATWNSVMITVSQATPAPCCWWSAISAVLSQHPQLAWLFSLLQPLRCVKHSTRVCGGSGGTKVTIHLAARLSRHELPLVLFPAHKARTSAN